MIDIHNHILPAIDDGAKDQDIALNMLKMASKDGIPKIIATPHFIEGVMENNCVIVKEKCSELNRMAVKEQLEIEVYPGSEVFISPQIPDLVELGIIPTLNDSAYVLIEFPGMGIPSYTYDVIYHLELKGYIPIIAHPERNRDIYKHPNLIYELIQRGCRIQVNAHSFKGFYGKVVKETAFQLLNHGMVHFISSDAHSDGHRAPKLRSSFELIGESVGAEAADELFRRNAQAVIENRIFTPQKAEVISHKKSFNIAKILTLLTGVKS